jgi:AcrR family transcriptional regulator
MPKNLSPAEVQAFRARLCTVAARRFAAHGYDGVSMRGLAEELGCSAMTPYRYFRDKDDVLAAVRAAAFDRFAASLESAVARAGGDARGAGRAVGEAYIDFALAEPDAYRLMFDLTQANPDRYPELVRASGRARRTMTAHLETLAAAGEFHGDPQLLAYCFWAAMHGLAMLELAGKLPGKPDRRTIQRELMRLIAEGARVSAAPRETRSSVRGKRSAR